MFQMFGFAKGGLYDPPPSKFNAKEFWTSISRGATYLGSFSAPNGLIIYYKYLIIHKFIC